MMTIGYGNPKPEHYKLLDIDLASAAMLLWPKRITYSNGLANLPACHALFHIVRWYVPAQGIAEDAERTYWYRLYRGDLLQMSSSYLQNASGLSKKQARDAFDALEELGLIRCELRSLTLPNGQKLSNVRFIDINTSRILGISVNDLPDDDTTCNEPGHTLCPTGHTPLCPTGHTYTSGVDSESLRELDTNVSNCSDVKNPQVAVNLALDEKLSSAACGAGVFTQIPNDLFVNDQSSDVVTGNTAACEKSRDVKTKAKRGPRKANDSTPKAREPDETEGRIIEELEAVDPVMAAEAYKRIGRYNKAQPGAVVSLYMATGVRVPKAAWTDVERAAGETGEFDITRLVKCYKAWLLRGFNPVGLGWVTDWYINGVPQPGKKPNGVATVSTPYTAAPLAAVRVSAAEQQRQAEFDARMQSMIAARRGSVGNG